MHLHHVHLFATDIDATVAWWREKLGGVVAFDGAFGGARNVFMEVGSGRLHLYDQPPRGAPGGAVHHVGIQTDDLPALHRRLLALGVSFRSGIREFGVVALHHVRGAGRRAAGALPDRHGRHAARVGPLFRSLTLQAVALCAVSARHR